MLVQGWACAKVIKAVPCAATDSRTTTITMAAQVQRVRVQHPNGAVHRYDETLFCWTDCAFRSLARVCGISSAELYRVLQQNYQAWFPAHGPTLDQQLNSDGFVTPELVQHLKSVYAIDSVNFSQITPWVQASNWLATLAVYCSKRKVSVKSEFALRFTASAIGGDIGHVVMGVYTPPG
jgi:hypothetical protein